MVGTLANAFACVASGAEGVEHHRGHETVDWEPQLGWLRYRGAKPNPSKYETGLDASDSIHVPAEGRRDFFS
jgi:hypothetical protein